MGLPPCERHLRRLQRRRWSLALLGGWSVICRKLYHWLIGVVFTLVGKTIATTDYSQVGADVSSADVARAMVVHSSRRSGKRAMVERVVDELNRRAKVAR